MGPANSLFGRSSMARHHPRPGRIRFSPARVMCNGWITSWGCIGQEWICGDIASWISGRSVPLRTRFWRPLPKGDFLPHCIRPIESARVGVCSWQPLPRILRQGAEGETFVGRRRCKWWPSDHPSALMVGGR